MVGLIERPVQIGGLQPTFLLLRDFKDAAAIDAFGTLEFKLIPVDPTRKSVDWGESHATYIPYSKMLDVKSFTGSFLTLKFKNRDEPAEYQVLPGSVKIKRRRRETGSIA